MGKGRAPFSKRGPSPSPISQSLFLPQAFQHFAGGLEHVVEVLVAEPVLEGEGNLAVEEGVGVGAVGLAEAEFLVEVVTVERDVLHHALDALFLGNGVHEGVALAVPHAAREQVVIVAGGIVAEELQLGVILEGVDEADGPGALFGVDPVDALKHLDAEGAFDLAEAVVVGPEHVAVEHGHVHVAHRRGPVVGPGLGIAAVPVVAQGGDQRGELRVLDDQHAAFAERGEVLVGMEREDRHVAPRAGLDAVDVRADGLGRVLDDEHVVLFRHFHDRGHVRHIAVKMHDDDGFGFGRDALFDGFGVDHVRDGIDVRPDELRALLGERVGRGRERVRRDDDFIAGLEVAELRGKLERGHAVHHRKAMLGPDVLAERLLEGLKVFALRQRFRVPHGFHDHRDLVFGVLDRTSAEIHFDVHMLSCL